MTDLNPKIDFEVTDFNNPNILVIIDNSNWGAIKEKRSVIEILRPGYVEPFIDYFNKYKYIANNSIFGATCDDCDDVQPMSDGVYTITIKGSPDAFSKTKYFFKTSTIDLEIAEMYVKKGINDKAFKSKIQKVEYLLTFASSHVKVGDLNTAGVFYNKARKELDKLKNCK